MSISGAITSASPSGRALVDGLRDCSSGMKLPRPDAWLLEKFDGLETFLVALDDHVLKPVAEHGGQCLFVVFPALR